MAIPDLEFVIARFNENTAWTSRLPGKVTIYNKGDSDLPQATRLPNIGRESHTYLTHIVKNIRELAHCTIFCQGRSLNHAPALRSFREPRGEFGFLTKRILTCDFNGGPHHRGLPIATLWDRLMPQRTKPSLLEFGAGAIFYVSRASVESNSLAFYQKALELHQEWPVAPWAFERLWRYLFMPSTCV